MKQCLQNKLYKKYPKIFRQKDLDMTQTCMVWGLECGPGWFQIIDDLCNYIQSYVDCDNCKQVEATQVKEKYGKLCVYVDSADEHIHGAIAYAEYLSGLTCEDCGTRENVSRNQHGWISTLCKKCRKEQESGKRKD